MPKPPSYPASSFPLTSSFGQTSMHCKEWKLEVWDWCLNVRHGSYCVLFLFLSHKSVGVFTPRGLLGLHVCDIKDIWYHSDNNHYIIGPKLKRTFSSLKHYGSLWLDFILFRCFHSRGCFFCATEGCSGLGGNDKAACGCAFCCWKQIGCESFPLCYENWKHWNSYGLKWLAILKNYNR